MTTVRKKKKGHEDKNREPEVVLDKRSKKFLWALAIIGGVMALVLTALEFMK